MPSLLPRSKKLRTALLVLVSIVVIGIVAEPAREHRRLRVQAQVEGGAQRSAPPKTTAAALRLSHRHGRASRTPGSPTKIKAPVRRAVLDATQIYVDDAVLAPLKNGQVDNGYETLFDSGVKTAAVGPGPARTHGGEAPASSRGAVHATASPVRVDGIGDQIRQDRPGRDHVRADGEGVDTGRGRSRSAEHRADVREPVRAVAASPRTTSGRTNGRHHGRVEGRATTGVTGPSGVAS